MKASKPCYKSPCPVPPRSKPRLGHVITSPERTNSCPSRGSVLRRQPKYKSPTPWPFENECPRNPNNRNNSRNSKSFLTKWHSSRDTNTTQSINTPQHGHTSQNGLISNSGFHSSNGDSNRRGRHKRFCNLNRYLPPLPLLHQRGSFSRKLMRPRQHQRRRWVSDNLSARLRHLFGELLRVLLSNSLVLLITGVFLHRLRSQCSLPLPPYSEPR